MLKHPIEPNQPNRRTIEMAIENHTTGVSSDDQKLILEWISFETDEVCISGQIYALNGLSADHPAVSKLHPRQAFRLGYECSRVWAVRRSRKIKLTQDPQD